MDPLVSIIIPCYNASAYVADAIASALSQTASPAEVVVIDDGSTDGSLDVIRSFDGRIRWFSGRNCGGSAARNRGLREARGKWIQFLDADDVLLPSCVESKLRYSLGRNIVPCSELGAFGVFSEGLPRFGPDFWRKDRWTLDYMLSFGPPQTAAPLHQKTHLERIGGFREDLPRAQDWDLHLRLAIVFGVEYESNGELGVLIRPVQTSVSRSSGAKMPMTHADALSDLVPMLDEYGLMTAERAALIAQRLTILAKKVWDAGLRREATSIVRRAMQISPRWYGGAYQTKLAKTVVRVFGFESYERLRGWIRAG